MIVADGYNHSLEMLYEFAKANHERGLLQQRLSTGKSINRAEDDPAGVSLATKLESRIRGQAQALANIEDAKGLLSTKEQNLTSVVEILMKMQEKATQGANDTLDTQARHLINRELQSLAGEITTVLTTGTYGEVSLDTSTPFSFQVDEDAGSTFTTNSDDGPQTLAFGDLNEGIASWDALTGTGYIMYTEDDIYSRFGANPGIDRADHLVAVVYQGGQWYWSAWHGLTAFTPTGSDRLLAEVDFDADTAQNLEGVDDRINGISAGYTSGDLVVTPNQFGNPPAASPDDFLVAGTQVIAPAPTLADELTFSTSQLDVTTASSAQALLGSIESALGIANTEIQALGDYQQILTLKSELLNIKMIGSSQARSRIEDADFAKEQIQIAKMEILQNTGVAALTQNVSNYEMVLQLL